MFFSSWSLGSIYNIQNIWIQSTSCQLNSPDTDHSMNYQIHIFMPKYFYTKNTNRINIVKNYDLIFFVWNSLFLLFFCLTDHSSTQQCVITDVLYIHMHKINYCSFQTIYMQRQHSDALEQAIKRF